MKSLLIALAVVASVLALSAEEWRIYNNDKYKYEVQYPDSYEVIITGPKQDSDGRTIRIALKEIARLHGIDIKIHPGMSLERIMLEIKAPELSKIESGDVTIETKLHKIIWQKTTANGVPAVKMQVKSVENSQLLLTSLIMDQVIITAHLWPDAGLDEKLTGRIISTFKWKAATLTWPSTIQ